MPERKKKIIIFVLSENDVIHCEWEFRVNSLFGSISNRQFVFAFHMRGEKNILVVWKEAYNLSHKLVTKST